LAADLSEVFLIEGRIHVLFFNFSVSQTIFKIGPHKLENSFKNELQLFFLSEEFLLSVCNFSFHNLEQVLVKFLHIEHTVLAQSHVVLSFHQIFKDQHLGRVQLLQRSRLFSIAKT